MSLIVKNFSLRPNVLLRHYYKFLKNYGHSVSSIIIKRNIYTNEHLKLPEELNSQSETGSEYAQSETPYILQPVNKSSASEFKIKKISKAMKAYLERANSHNVFLSEKNDEFEIGKHHLANMMGLDVGTMTQHDIDSAIEYLLPSGLYEPKARPLMKPPEELFPKEKAAQFDDSGRPFSTFFYTKKSNFHETMHQIVEKLHELDSIEDRMLRKGISSPPEEYTLNLAGGTWITLEEFNGIFLEKLSQTDYDFITTTLTRLAEHPYGFRQKEFIWKFRKDYMDLSSLQSIPELMYDENGRPYMQARGRKINALGNVTVWGNGMGKITINDKYDLDYFYRLEDRNQILLPLELSNMIGKVDIEATLTNGGISTQAAVIQYCVAMCLRSFVSPEINERLRYAGLLTYDMRIRERKKPGQKGARAKFKWRKR